MKVTKISETEEEVEINGHKVTRLKDGINIKCEINGSKPITLGQRVYSNGRFGPPAGTIGIVIGIHLPGHDGYSTNVFEVWFEGERGPLDMKTKDLQTEKLS